MIKRSLQQVIESRLFKGKAVLLFGARQTGKSTLIDIILADQSRGHLVMNGDDADVRDILAQATATKLKALIGKNEILVIDEAQRIENIGLALKLVTDQLKQVQVIATGSSSFELSGSVNEPLTGRKYEFRVFPLSFQEMVNHHGLLAEKRLIEHRMIYGYYPEIVTHAGEEKERLKLLAGSYLYKDLLMIDQIKKPLLLEKLLQALALQVGHEVRYNEVAQVVGSDPKTVEKYIGLLEDAFVVFQVPAFSRNVRNEIRKGKKVYFYDCGIRNAVINNFKSLGSRNDVGALWENYILVERMKYLRNKGIDTKFYFWRTTQQQEIDLVEESESGLSAFEFKWKNARARISQTFTNNYPEATTGIITRENMEEFVSTSHH